MMRLIKLTLWCLLLFNSESVLGEVTWSDAFSMLASEQLPRGHGYLLVDTSVKQEGVSWHFDDKELLPVSPPPGRHLKLLKLPKGSYTFDRVEVPLFDLPYKLTLKGEQWHFYIHSGSINYMGSLFVGESRGTDSVDVRLLNRTAEVVSLIESHHPELLTTIDLRYAGNLSDDFLKQFPPKKAAVR